MQTSADSVSRRQFLGKSLLAATCLSGKVVGEESGLDSLKLQLQTALDSAGFDQSSGDGVVLGIFSDPHIFVGSEYPTLVTEKWDDDLINELNALHPPITHLVLAGDLISHRSMTPGLPRYPSHEVRAEQEYALAQVEVQRFDAPMWMIPGNHDTDAYETDAEMFQEKMGSLPYQRLELGGVPVLLLNTGNAGMLNTSQENWLAAEAATIAPDREVLIIQHVPTFATVYTQAGSKRIIAKAFAGRSAPVYIASGHHHRFGESVSELGGTSFVQMTTTTASRVVFNDKRNPGYLVVALQNGRVLMRAQRSLTATGFWLRPPITSLPVSPVRFPFDNVSFLMGKYEEGFYQINEYLEFNGVHVGCYIAYCKKVIVRFRPTDYWGRARRFILSGEITAANTPRCWLSVDGNQGPWRELVFPPPAGAGLYTVDLPSDIDTAEEVFIMFDTGLTGNVNGFSWSGWALASNEGAITGFEHWLYQLYGTLERNELTAIESIAKNGNHSNIETYAFNLPPWQTGEVSGCPGDLRFEIDGESEIMKVSCTMLRNPQEGGVRYIGEYSEGFENWDSFDLESAEHMILGEDGEYRRVELKIPISAAAKNGVFRVRLVPLASIGYK